MNKNKRTFNQPAIAKAVDIIAKELRKGNKSDVLEIVIKFAPSKLPPNATVIGNREEECKNERFICYKLPNGEEECIWLCD